MDEMAPLEDGCQQVPGAACYQDNDLFIVMLQGSAATALSPSDLSKLGENYRNCDKIIIVSTIDSLMKKAGEKSIFLSAENLVFFELPHFDNGIYEMLTFKN